MLMELLKSSSEKPFEGVGAKYTETNPRQIVMAVMVIISIFFLKN